jgi:hypothetical protein
MRNYNEKTDFSFDIRERLGVITEKKNGWKKELNIVCWNGREPAKFDIRDWSQDHSHMGRGVTLYQEELQTLVELYQRYEEAVREFDAAEQCRNQAALRNVAVQNQACRQEPVQNAVPPAGYQESAAVQDDAPAADCGDQESAQAEEWNRQEGGLEGIQEADLPENAAVLQQTAAAESSASAQI